MQPLLLIIAAGFITLINPVKVLIIVVQFYTALFFLFGVWYWLVFQPNRT